MLYTATARASGTAALVALQLWEGTRMSQQLHPAVLQTHSSLGLHITQPCLQPGPVPTPRSSLCFAYPSPTFPKGSAFVPKGIRL